MDENETTENTPRFPRKVLVFGAAAVGLIVAGGFLHLKNKAHAEEVEGSEVESDPTP